MLALRVGDPHAKVSNLAELEKLMLFVLDIVRERKVNRLELLGDLFHTHAVLRLEVLEFWDKWLNMLSERVETFAIVGNHDQTGDYALHTNALNVFKRMASNRLHIIDEPKRFGPFAYMPYYHDSEIFIQLANGQAALGAKILVSHQTYSGSKYENGFFAPDGINPDLLNFDIIISGHIHARQRFGKVIYPGTARWDSNSDANQPKGLWLVDHDDNTGAIIEEEFITTVGVCEPICTFTWIEGEAKPEIPPVGRITVELVGSSAWVALQKAELKGSVALKSKITDKTTTEARKTGANLHDFISNLFTSTMNKEDLLAYAKELGIE